MADNFQIATLCSGNYPPSVALATQRAGGLAFLDLEYASEQVPVIDAVRAFSATSAGSFGVKLCADAPAFIEGIASELAPQVSTVLLTAAEPANLASAVLRLRERGIRVLLEVTSVAQADAGESLQVDGLIAKGHEAGGRVGDETTFILLQRLYSRTRIPVWAHGGIGLHTAAACAAAGAAGVILDLQLALARESALPEDVKTRIAAMDGSETILVGDNVGELYRVYFRPGSQVVADLQQAELRIAASSESLQDRLASWRAYVQSRAGWRVGHDALMLGQDAAFAANLAERFRTVGGILQAIREAVASHCRSAVRLQSLSEQSPLAAANGTRYPILQGPMTRVSDVPEFAKHVAAGGGLPFLALALMRGPEVRAMLQDARSRMGSLPWGVGILGFVPQELRQEQMAVIREFAPPFALIAGGRPDQARELEQIGTRSYLHVPSPGLLKMFVQQGARRFIFEGRECGGHVGPRTSFVLWNQMIDVLLDTPELSASPEEFHIVFAAGIHDALSAAMVSVLAAPLAERGVCIGALLGTAYLFTEEAVRSGAILPAFQQQALECHNTVLLETGPGHSTRCVDTAFAQVFSSEKRRLLNEGRPAEEIRETLEELNLGRLRIASKGVTRNSEFGRDAAAPKLVRVDETEQLTQGMYMIGQVAALRNEVCTIEQLHASISRDGAEVLNSLAGRASSTTTESRVETPSEVAIVGMSCLLPKAPDLQTFWENILNKVDAVSEIPKDRWNWELFFDADPKAKDKIYSKWGGFLEDRAFDPMLYGMPPASLRSIEPAHLLTLEAVRAAIDDAGYLNRPFPKERTSVILGAGGGAADLGLGYGARSFMPMLEELPEFEGRSKEIVERLDGVLPEWTEDSFAGILTNVAAGRVANRFDLGGSNFTVDAACASSLAAVSLGLRELENGTSDMVVAGGIDTMQNPFTYLCFSKTHALSPRGKCRTFDETADGIAISEGIVILVFKRLADAERDGDRIYAVIRGAGSSSDGKDRGLTAPRPEGQARALRRAYAKAGVSPASVGLVEAHGTGTAAGDSAEVQALTKVFSEAQAERQRCAIGSVKSMIGHTKCSAGAAGLAKAAMALHRKVLPPTLGVEKPNPRARFEESPFFVNTEARPWLANPDGQPRRAGVSAFGFGGTNFHVVVEEYTGDPYSEAPAPRQTWSEELFLFRAATRQDLRSEMERWSSALAVEAEPPLRHLACTAWKKAEGIIPTLQLAIVASSVADLRQKLASAVDALSQPGEARINDPRGIYFSDTPLAAEGKLAFLFPGQGSQYPRMLQDVLLHFPELRQIAETADRVVEGKLDRPLTSYLFPPPSFGKEEERNYAKALTQTNVAQPALGVADLAMFRLLTELGLQPDMAAGHSYGEYVALAAAGALEPADLIAVSEARGRFIVESAGADPGTMAAVDAEASVVLEVLAGYEGVCIANANAPRQTVISGPTPAVEAVVEYFNSQGRTARLIPVACAFHSPLVAGAQPKLAEFLADAPIRETRFTVFSNTTAAPYPTEPDEVRNRLVDHVARPVEFVREIEAMYESGARVFVEVGPRAVLTGLTDQILADRPRLVVACNQNGRSGLTQLLHALGQIAAHGQALQLDRLFRGRNARQLNLATLQQEFGKKPLPASTWFVNGARAIPMNEAGKPKPRKAPLPAVVPPLAAAATAAASAIPTAPLPVATPASPVAAVPVTPTPVLPLTPTSPAPEGVTEVMAQFQSMMTTFLETQKTVLMAYLGAGAATAPVVSMPLAAAVPTPAPTPVAVPVAAPVLAQQPVTTLELAQEPAPVSPAAAIVVPAVSRDELTRQLLAIVSERTGYPPEMLDLNLDLEADLGIDSIKRVEILGTFQQTLAGIVATEGLMEKLNGVRTLQTIINRVLDDSAAVATAPVAVVEVIPSAPVSKGLNANEVTNQLLSIVSERTGYPAEMLGLTLDLEADLGIDSIKRVEILGTVQQVLTAAGAQLPEGLMEKLSGVRTLQGIIACLTSEPAPAQVASAPVIRALPEPVVVVPVQEAETEHDDSVDRFTLALKPLPLLDQPNGLIAPGRTVLITGASPVAGALAERLRTAGDRVVTISHAHVASSGADSYAADLTSPGAVTDLVSEIRRQYGPVGAVVHLLPLDCRRTWPDYDLSSWKEETALSIKSLFLVAKATASDLLQSAADGGAVLLSATAMGGEFLTEAAPRSASVAHGGVAGIIKTLAFEWSGVRLRSVDLDTTEAAETLASYLHSELTAEAQPVEVCYSGGARFTPEMQREAAAVAAPLAVDPSSVVLITGGARGITARAAIRLAEKYQPTLVLVGRSPLPPAEESPETAGITGVKELKAALIEQLRRQGDAVTPATVEKAYSRLQAEREMRSNLEALQRTGAQVHYYPADVRDPEVFGALIDGVYTTFGRLDGVVHGAGVIEDRLLQDKSPESFARVFDTKVDSAFLLASKVRPAGLKFLVFFSSVSGRFGNRGQADYAAANEVLNKLAVCLNRSWQSRVVAINWGPWDTEGMVSAEVRRQFNERGVSLIRPAVGLRYFEEELPLPAGAAAEVVVGGATSLTGAPQATAKPTLPMLLHATESDSTFIREFSTSRDVFLLDHMIDGQPVVPMAVVTELIAETVAHQSPGMQVVAIHGLRALHGIVLSDGDRQVRIRTTPAGEGRISVDVSAVGHPRRLHYQAVVEVARNLPEAPVLDIPPVTDAAPFRMSVADLYQRWLFHGPRFEGIVSVDAVAPAGITSRLRVCSPKGFIEGVQNGSWLIDPLMFDSGLHLILLGGREHWDMTTLPAAFQTLRRYAAPPASEVICELRLRPNTLAPKSHSDLYFLDANTRRVIAVVEDMQGTSSKSLNRLAGGQAVAVAGQ